mmetsp:Transcript_40245/g.110688  ORF Transcript_40245/g.110688 Transcript_40245/m.110688 type:complete len:703 (-) Transcript_40245:102-2210(-)
MTTPEALGVDAKASEMLAELPDEHQQRILANLIAALDAGKVNNVSAYVVAAVRAPDSLGLDENAQKLLRQLTSTQQKDLLSKLRRADDVANKSAWVVAAIRELGVTTPRNQCGLKELDGSAKALLQSLPADHQTEIIERLKPLNGIRNPSAWVSKAAVAAGATPLPSAAPALGLDERAAALVAQLPPEQQDDITAKLLELTSSGQVRNPSGWATRAALNAGAQIEGAGPQQNPMATAHLDENAAALLAQLPKHVRDDISNRVQEMMASGQLKNASAWVERAAVNAGAKKTGGVTRQANDHAYDYVDDHAEYSMEVDEKAAALLAQLPKKARVDIANKVKELTAMGQVRNPSAWVEKSALNAGARKPISVVQPAPPAFEPTVDIPEVDEKAAALLAQLPNEAQVDIANKVKELTSLGQVRNPSAWVEKSALNAGARKLTSAAQPAPARPAQPVYEPAMGVGENLALDGNAAALLAQLPTAVRIDIANKVQELTAFGQVRNPSAWVERAALNAGARKSLGAAQRAQPVFAPDNTATALQDLDETAAALLAQLPKETRLDIANRVQELKATGQVRNPSAWVERAALNAGARKSSGVAQPAQLFVAPGVSLDETATFLLAQLPKEMQVDIASKVGQMVGLGQVKNPSAWVVKSALNAGAKRESVPGGGCASAGGGVIGGGADGKGSKVPSSTGKAGMKGGFRAKPY